MKLATNDKEKTENTDTLLNSGGSQLTPREKSKVIRGVKGKHNTKSLGHSEGRPKGGIRSNTGLALEARKISNSLTRHLKELEEEQQSPKEVGERE